MTGRRAFVRTEDIGWYGRVWALAWPIILANSSVPLLGMVDTAVVGRLPDAYYIGAVAVGAVIFSFLYWGFGFLRMATGGFTAQAHGADDPDEVRAVLGRALILAGMFGAAIIALQAPAIDLALYLVGPSPEVAELARQYFVVRVWSAPAALANFAILGWYIGLQNTRVALVVQVFMNGLNIVLDLAFVSGFGWGVPGVALASMIAEYAAAALGLLFVARTLARIGGRWRRAHVLDGARLRRLMAVNRDIFIRNLGVIVAFSYFTARGARIDDVTLATNAVLLHLLTMQSFGLDGFAHAAEAMVGKALGARDPAALRRAVRVSTHWAAIVALLYVLVTAAFGPSIVALLTDQAPVRAMAADYLPWLIATPLVAMWAFQLDGIFVGATQSREMRNGMIAAFAVYGAAMWLAPPVLGNHGLWLAVLAFLAARGAALAIFYPRIVRAAEI